MRIQNLTLILFFMLQLSACGMRTEKSSGIYHSELVLPLEKSELINNELQNYADKLSLNIDNFHVGELSLQSLVRAIPSLPDTVKGVCVVQGRNRSIALTIGRDLNFDLSIILHELGHCAMNLPHKEIAEWPYHLVRGHLIPKHVMYAHFIVENKIILACEDVFIKNLKTGVAVSKKELKACLQNIDTDVVSNDSDNEED